ncbi:Uma2 family endonuclease [Corallococcus praedator]|uniref:Uma2 family endonuclease n=1 Tax=Corallococcus praedator TaxID=2316724 RepID=A0ABX9QPK8_9BACT|nr:MULTISPECIES: Uma2 family endonuclease [Corallococcus]RKH20860.1 Uma2 family endonuclease [Corallococcus sp. CA047B]RKH35414.1 Uma2 family endonuclease [Corallococcus sp. CA031C]RKI15705.1 Uma2 family endonuclease [Corallococcus praedator]
MGNGDRKPATYADLEGVPPTKVGELIEGALVISPRPASRHTRAATKLGAWLDGAFDLGRNGPGGWLVLDAPELRFPHPGDALVPDVAAWRRERMPELPDVPFFLLAPDWVCEVVSDVTRTWDRGPKMRVYAREGVEWLWFIDPLAEGLEIHRLRDGQWRLFGVHLGSGTVDAEPFDAVPLNLGRLWSR